MPSLCSDHLSVIGRITECARGAWHDRRRKRTALHLKGAWRLFEPDVFQFGQLVPELTAADNVGNPSGPRRRSLSAACRRVIPHSQPPGEPSGR